MGGRSRDELRKMRAAGRVVAEMHERIRDAIRPGVTTGELDLIGREVIEPRGATSNFLGYHGFPAVICASPNDVIVHGIPGPTVLDEGDIISIDCGAIVDGWHGDAAFTAGVGEVSAEAARLIEVTRQSMMAGIAAMVPGGRMGDVGARRAVGGRGRRVLGGARVRRPRHRPGDAREARGPELRHSRARAPSSRGG